MSKATEGILLHCSYVANWQITQLGTALECELATTSYNYPIINITASTFDVLINPQSYTNSSTTAQVLEYCYTGDNVTGTWTDLIPNFTGIEELTIETNKITAQAINGQCVQIATN